MSLRIRNASSPRVSLTLCPQLISCIFFVLQGKGTEDTINRYQGCQLLFLDIPNIHAVRDSLYRLQGVCESSAQKKWLSHLESTQWLAYITSILKVNYGIKQTIIIRVPVLGPLLQTNQNVMISHIKSSDDSDISLINGHL